MSPRGKDREYEFNILFRKCLLGPARISSNSVLELAKPLTTGGF